MKKTFKNKLIQKLKNLQISIFGFPYTLYFESDLMSRFNVTGCASVWGSDIRVDSALGSLDTCSTILHEIIETMFRKTETKYEHDIVAKFETFMMATIIENPELMEAIVEAAKKEGGSIKAGVQKSVKKLGLGGKGKG